MLKANHLAMIEIANKNLKAESVRTRSLAEAVIDSIENDLVSPSMLKTKLEELEFVNCRIEKFEKSIQFEFYSDLEPRLEVGETEPTEDIWARGRSQTWQDAVLHAILGYFRECEKGQR